MDKFIEFARKQNNLTEDSLNKLLIHDSDDYNLYKRLVAVTAISDKVGIYFKLEQ